MSKDKWYYLKDENPRGPIETNDLKTLFQLGELDEKSLIRNEDMSDWLPASDIVTFETYYPENQVAPDNIQMLTFVPLFWGIPILLGVWSLFQPEEAGTGFASIYILLFMCLFFGDISKPKIDPNMWIPEEIKVIKNYHVALRYPYGAKICSVLLNGFRWTSILLGIWMAINGIWFCVILFVILFIITAPISVRLDPFFFLHEGATKGNVFLMEELATLRRVNDKLKMSDRE